MRLASLLLIVCMSCGDDYVALDAPPATLEVFTWKDAENVWSEVWCSYFERCAPDRFVALYGVDFATCVSDTTAIACTQSTRVWPACDVAYPEDRRATLEACLVESAAVACYGQVPDSCVRAFE